MSNCLDIINLINRGQLTKDHAGHVVHTNGNPIHRIGNENFIQAFEHESRPSTHFIMILSDTDGDINSDDDSSNDQNGDLSLEWLFDFELQDVFAVRDAQGISHAVQHPEKHIAAKQKQVMEGVYPPQLKDVYPRKENQPVSSETGRPIQGTRVLPSPIKRLDRHVDMPQIIKEPVPIEVDKPRFDGRKDAEIIED
jgi:hypothetical protein